MPKRSPPTPAPAVPRSVRVTPPAEQFVEVWSAWRSAARTWRLASAALAAACLWFAWGWHQAATTFPEPMVIRVDRAGRAVPVRYGDMGFSYSATDPVTTHFLRKTVLGLYERGPDGLASWREALAFLHPDLVNWHARLAGEEIASYEAGDIRGTIAVEGWDLLVSPGEGSEPHRARIEFDRVRRVDGGERSRQPLTVLVSFVFVGAARIPEEAVLINPVGLVITDLDEKVRLE